jgi:hypothetical protein
MLLYVFIFFIYNYIFNNIKYVIKIASISKKQYSKCYQHFDITCFTSKTGRNLKTYINYQEQAVTIY